MKGRASWSCLSCDGTKFRSSCAVGMVAVRLSHGDVTFMNQFGKVLG